VRRHARGATKLRVMFGDEIAIGPGKAELLAAIAETGSISASAKRLGMSYRRAWLLVDTMNRCFREPVVASATGGSGGGGARVTDFGRRVLARFGSMRARIDGALDAELDAFSELLADRPH
jgi:molybdate transport system regulatory protein